MWWSERGGCVQYFVRAFQFHEKCLQVESGKKLEDEMSRVPKLTI